MKKQNMEFRTRENEILRITSYGIDNIEKSPCIVFVPGFKGFKDWGFGPYLAEAFANKGLFVLTFNFSHNGVGESLTEFIELDKFAQNTFSREIQELSELIDAYKNNYFGNSAANKIALLGHSRGGAISLLTAALKPEVNAVAVWSSVAFLDRYSERQKKEWKEKGFFEVMNQRTGQRMRMNKSLLDDIEQNSNNLLNIKKAVHNLNRPLLIAHGEQDLSVPIKEGEQLYDWSDKSKTEFYKVSNAGHTFNIKHPFEGSNDKFENLLNKTYEFFNQNLT